LNFRFNENKSLLSILLVALLISVIPSTMRLGAPIRVMANKLPSFDSKQSVSSSDNAGSSSSDNAGSSSSDSIPAPPASESASSSNNQQVPIHPLCPPGQVREPNGGCIPGPLGFGGFLAHNSSNQLATAVKPLDCPQGQTREPNGKCVDFSSP
jgi:hypothetical protein